MANDIMKYWTKVFNKPYPDGWKDKPNKTTPIRGKVMDAYDSAMDEVDDRVLSLGKSVVDHDFMIEQLAGNISETNKALNSANIESQKAIAELDDKKITKVYANSDGKTVLTDSDNGKIQDMILYGKSEQKQYSGKNLLNCTIETTTINGVTLTNNGDGTYTLNGTASGDATFILGRIATDSSPVKLVGCPPNGSYSTYRLNLSGYGSDIGSGNTFDSPINDTGMLLQVISGTVCNNLLFKPMITTDESATYDDFEPYVGGIPSPNPDYPQEIKSVVNPVVTLSDGENSQTATLPFTLNAIPVSDGGNVTIDGQQYIADYVDVERKKIVRNVGKTTLYNTDYEGSNSVGTNAYYIRMKIKAKNDNSSICVISDKFIGVPLDKIISNTNIDEVMSQDGKVVLRTKNNTSLDWSTEEKCRQWLEDNTPTVVYILETPTEEPLTDEQVNALKALSTYYPTTNVAVTSDELDGYVTFDYPLCFDSAAEYAVGSLQFAFESGLPAANFRIYGSDSKESMYDIRIAVFDSTGAPKQLTQFSLYAYGGKSVGNGTVNTSYGTIRQSGSGYIQLETKEDYNWKVWISGKGWRVEKV